MFINEFNLKLLISLILIAGVSTSALFDCNFDNDTCNWSDVNQVWSIGSSISDQHNLTWTPIQGDHHFGPGGYLYLDPIKLSTKQSKQGILTSSQLTGSYKCLTFWYYMFGLESGELTIVQSINTIDNVVWKRQSNFGRKWIKSSVELIVAYNDQPWTVAFRAAYADIYHEIMSIDDVQLANGLCPSTSETCDLELSDCSLENQSVGNSFWTTGTALSLSHPLISTDHSTLTETGHLAYIRGVDAKDVAIFKTETFNHTGQRCLTFWYTSTSDSAEMKIFQVDQQGHGSSDSLWTRNRNHYGDWRQGIVQLKEMTSSSYNIDFRVSFNQPNGGYYALDDLTIETGSCPDSVNCDFTFNTCQWVTTNTMETFDWIRMNGQLLGSSLIGPGKGQDEKDADDFYLYAYFDPSVPIESAIIDSGDFDVTSQDHYCLQFNLFTVNRVKLMLTVEMLQNADELRPVFILKDEDLPESKWQLISTLINVNSSQTVNDFQFLRLRATYVSEEEELGPDGKPKPHPFAAIAIDDISLTEGVCNGQEPQLTSTQSPPSTYQLYCDFETDLCGLFNDPLKTTSPWYRRTSTRTKSDVINVPTTDHTNEQPDGHFLFSRLQTKGDKKISELSTQTIKAIDSDQGACLSFWYYIRGTKSTSLSISMVKSSDLVETIIWKRENIYADYWYYGYVNIIPVTYDFTLKLIADHATDSDSGIALDDIGYSLAPCPVSVNNEGCDFELGSCGFDNGNSFNEIWTLTTGSAISSIHTDYTTQTGQGSFIIAQNDSMLADDEDDKSGYLIYDKFIISKYNCMQFAVNVHDGQLSFISALADDQEVLTGITLWSINETTGWTLVRLPLPFPDDAKLIAYRFKGQGYAALDDVSFLTECQPMGYCNFERDSCGWTSESNGFKRDHGRLSDSYSPPYDVTTKKDSGSYSIVNFAKGKSNEKYSLTSPLISPMVPMTNYCLSYWYYENGKGIPTLHTLVNQINSNGSQKTTYLQTIEPSARLDFWDRKSIPITELTGSPFTIELRASVKKATARPALVAIDDIELYPGQCSDSIEVIDETVYSCDSQTTKITGNLLCDFHADCEDAWDESNCGYNCDFETGSCGWKGGAKANGPLTIIDLGKTKTIPSYEINFNETGKGKYWKLNSKTSTTLTYLSPVMRNSGEHCYINFYLYMNIVEDAKAQLKDSDLSKLPHLSISLIDLRSTQVTPIHEVVNDLGTNWFSVKLYIGRIPSDFQLQFEVHTKKGADRIVIDQITADPNCAVPRIGDADLCPSNEFYCSRSKRCIDPSLTCDYRDDCGDGEDEEDDLAQCSLRSGRCDFNQGHFCDWSSQTSTLKEEKWKLVDYDDDNSDQRSTLPTRDHTINTAEGKFAINTGTTGLPVYSLTSPPLFRPEPESICSFNFYYQFTDAQSVIKVTNASAIGQSIHNYLEVQIVLPHLTNSRNTLETILGSYSLDSPHFKRATINIGPEVVTSNRLFQLSLSAVRSSDSPSSWAVDDVSFSSDCIVADCYLRCGQDQSCISLDHRCDFISDCDATDDNVVGPDEAKCTSINCPFDQDDTCHWDIISPNSTNNLTWNLYQPLSDPVNQPPFIPKIDATNQGSASGWLLLFDSRDSNIEGSVELWSQMIGRSSAQCSLSFNYFCQLDQCDLTIYLETDIDRPDTNLKRLWEPHQLATNHDSTAKWRSGIALIGAIKFGRIMISGSSAFNQQPFAIGLDDLNFVNCAPPQPSQQEAPCDLITSFQCSNDNCIDKIYQCDFVDDCLDGSDESSCNNLPGRCDFEAPCTFWQPDSYRYDRFSYVSWSQTPDLPSTDHTLGVSSGTYLSLSGYQKPVDLWARHYSQIINGSQSKDSDCTINLWVNIVDYLLTSELVIYQRYNYSTSGYHVIARISPSNYLGEYWQKYNIKLPETDDAYQIVLEGFIAANNDASINIDDITLTSGCHLAENGTTLPGEPDQPTDPPTTEPLFDCYQGYKPCSSVTKCYPAEAECNFKDDCGDGTDEVDCPSYCTFENGWCGWTPTGSLKSGQWVIEKANDSSKPNRDHTEGDQSGSYGLAKFEQLADVSVLLNSPLFTSSGSRCTFTFYYYMTLETISDTDKQPRLQVHLNQGNQSKLIQSIGGKHTDEWYTSYINIGQQDEPFSLTIEAINLGESADLVKAIDDVAFDDCVSTKKSIIEDCPVNQWECQSKCLPVTQLCDGFNDCTDGQDEVNCPVVNGNCEFTNSWRGNCEWTEIDKIGETCPIINPSSTEINYIEIVAGDVFTCDVTLISPKFPSITNDYCHFVFQYKIETTSDETLFKIGLMSDGGKQIELQKFKGNRVSNDWTIYHLAINHSQSYQVYLTSAIDDDSKIYFKSFRFSANCPTGQPLTLDLYPGKMEPWEPSSPQPIVTTTTKLTTLSPVTQPTIPPRPTPSPKPRPTPPPKPTTKKPEPLTERPEDNCNCDDNTLTDECREICHKLSPQVLPKKHSNASILYISFGLIGSVAIIFISIKLLAPMVYRYRYRRTIRGILDDTFDDDGHFDTMDGRSSGSEQNLFGLLETRARLRNIDDSL